MKPVIFALLTALFWGLYGPTISASRQAEGGSAFKPYLLIGIAYLIWAILGGAIGMVKTNAPFTFTGWGVTWGFIGGSLGAFGALTLTLAMFSGGKPHSVMPIVFGGAVAVSAITGYLQTRNVAGTPPTSPWLWVGMVGMAVCIVIVASNTPHAAPPKKAQAAPAPATPTESPKSES